MPATADLTTDPAAVADLAQAIIAGRDCTAAEALALLGIDAASPAGAALFAGAQAIRAHFLGATLKSCSVVNVKAGNCSEDCSYCAQAAGSANTDYPKHKWMPDADIAVATTSSHANGAEALGLVAAWWGVREGSQLKMVTDAIRGFAGNGQVRPDVSLGMLESQRCADEIAAAGARVYGHNLETARSHYGTICTTHSWEDRLRTIEFVKKAGMGVCSGGIVGMGETRAQRVEFMEQLRFVQPDMIPINFLNPLPGTKLAHLPLMGADEALVTLAVFRFMLPDRNLAVAGGKEVVLKDRLDEVFRAGINGVMVGNYLTTCGADPQFWQKAAAKHGLRLPKPVQADAGQPAKPACGCG